MKVVDVIEYSGPFAFSTVFINAGTFQYSYTKGTNKLKVYKNDKFLKELEKEPVEIGNFIIVLMESLAE